MEVGVRSHSGSSGGSCCGGECGSHSGSSAGSSHGGRCRNLREPPACHSYRYMFPLFKVFKISDSYL